MMSALIECSYCGKAEHERCVSARGFCISCEQLHSRAERAENQIKELQSLIDKTMQDATEFQERAERAKAELEQAQSEHESVLQDYKNANVDLLLQIEAAQAKIKALRELESENAELRSLVFKFVINSTMDYDDESEMEVIELDFTGYQLTPNQVALVYEIKYPPESAESEVK